MKVLKVGSLDVALYLESWVGIDLDGTLAKIEEVNLKPPYPIGSPCEEVLAFVRFLYTNSVTCKLFTARVAKKESLTEQSEKIKEWLASHKISKYFSDITATKDPHMVLCLDDRSLRVYKGEISLPGFTNLTYEILN